MKDVRGWIALAIFCIACAIIGLQGFLLRKLNPTIIVMLVIAVVIVLVLDEFRGEKKSDDKSEK